MSSPHGNRRPKYEDDTQYDQYKQQEISQKYDSKSRKPQQAKLDDEPMNYDFGFDQGRVQETKSPGKKLPLEMSLQFSEFQDSKNRMYLCMIIVLVVFFVATVVLGGTSVAMTPWWKHSRVNPTYEWVQIGLIKSCFKEEENGEWKCISYDDSVENKTNYKDMNLLKILVITGTAIGGVGLILTIITIFFRKSNAFRPIMYVIGILSAGSAAMFGTCIGYVTGQNKSVILLPQWIINKTALKQTMDFGVMFFVACAAGACAFLAFIFTVVILFTSDDYDLEELEYIPEDEDDAYDEEGNQVKNKPSSPAEQNYDPGHKNYGYDRNTRPERHHRSHHKKHHSGHRSGRNHGHRNHDDYGSQEYYSRDHRRNHHSSDRNHHKRHRHSGPPTQMDQDHRQQQRNHPQDYRQEQVNPPQDHRQQQRYHPQDYRQEQMNRPKQHQSYRDLQDDNYSKCFNSPY